MLMEQWVLLPYTIHSSCYLAIKVFMPTLLEGFYQGTQRLLVLVVLFPFIFGAITALNPLDLGNNASEQPAPVVIIEAPTPTLVPIPTPTLVPIPTPSPIPTPTPMLTIQVITVDEIERATSGSIGYAGDVNWFRFSAIQGYEYTFRTDLESLGDSVMYLYDGGPYDSRRTLLIEDDDGGPDTASRIRWTADRSGELYIAVFGWLSNTGVYNLKYTYQNISNNSITISAGYQHTCGIKEDGTVECWGRDDNDQSSPPPGARFRSVSAGSQHTCGIKEDSTVECWGSNMDGLLFPPPNVRFRSVSAGASHTCGVIEDGTVECWGLGSNPNADESRSDYDQASPPPEHFQYVSAGGFHSCGIIEDGMLECWGLNNNDQSTPPSGRFQAVNAGENLTCGIREDGEVSCWGSDRFIPFSLDGVFQTISTGLDHMCGIREDGTVACFGSNIHSKSTPPSGIRFQTVSSGGGHTCGLNEDGTVKCWGWDRHGQSTPPSGKFRIGGGD